MYNKVVIWGYNLWGPHAQYHTHGHIHSSYYKAFRAMGYDTYWLNDADQLDNFDFSNTLFFTSGEQEKNIPIRKDCTYILHNGNIDKYKNNNLKYIHLFYYTKYCENGVSWHYEEDKIMDNLHNGKNALTDIGNNTVEKVDDLFFFDSQNSAVYLPWATDLLPQEINENDVCLYDPSKNVVNYIGTIYGNIPQMMPFVKACEDNHVKVVQYAGGISDADNKKLTRESYIAPDIRDDWHKECGYIPCRTFKNISYGQTTGTNSEHVYNIFGDMIAYSDNTYNLFAKSVEHSMATAKDSIKKSMLFVKNKHTYINRANSLLYIAGVI